MQIKPSDLGEIVLNETGAASVTQNVALIINTWMGTCPMYREFGITSEIMHKPKAVAESMMIASLQEAVEKFEPRCKVDAIAFADDGDDEGKIIPIVEVTINEQSI